MTISTLALFVLLGFQDDAAAKVEESKWKVQAKLSIVREDGEWVFRVDGTTNLPPDAILKTRVYALQVVDDPGPSGRGKRIDEEPLIWEGDEDAGQPAFRTVLATGGSFRSDVYRFRREPWAISYRARVIYDPNLQEDPVYKAVGLTDETSWFADIQFASPETYRNQLRERSIEVRDDLMQLEALFADFKKTYFAHREKHDPDQWKSWKRAWFDKVERLNERNKDRYGIWAVWLERQAKMRIGGMCTLLRSLLSDADDALKGKEDARPVTRERLDGLFGYLEEAIEVTGTHIPLPVDKVRPIMVAYESGFDPIRERVGNGTGDWKEIRGPARRTCVAAIMDLLPLMENRKRGYKYVNDLADRLADVVRTIDRGGSAKDAGAALEAHDAALKAFREFAGLDDAPAGK